MGLSQMKSKSMLKLDEEEAESYEEYQRKKCLNPKRCNDIWDCKETAEREACKPEDR